MAKRSYNVFTYNVSTNGTNKLGTRLLDELNSQNYSAQKSSSYSYKTQPYDIKINFIKNEDRMHKIVIGDNASNYYLKPIVNPIVDDYYDSNNNLYSSAFNGPTGLYYHNFGGNIYFTRPYFYIQFDKELFLSGFRQTGDSSLGLVDMNDNTYNLKDISFYYFDGYWKEIRMYQVQHIL